jgi:hypothetical protein
MNRYDAPDGLTPQQARERSERRVARAPLPVSPGSLAWASAVGNQSVQRVARERLVAREVAEEEPEVATAAPEAAEAEAAPAPEAPEAVEAVPPPAAAEGLATEHLEALAEVPEDAELLG